MRHSSTRYRVDRFGMVGTQKRRRSAQEPKSMSSSNWVEWWFKTRRSESGSFVCVKVWFCVCNASAWPLFGRTKLRDCMASTRHGLASIDKQDWNKSTRIERLCTSRASSRRRLFCGILASKWWSRLKAKVSSLCCWSVRCGMESLCGVVWEYVFLNRVDRLEWINFRFSYGQIGFLGFFNSASSSRRTSV